MTHFLGVSDASPNKAQIFFADFSRCSCRGFAALRKIRAQNSPCRDQPLYRAQNPPRNSAPKIRPENLPRKSAPKIRPENPPRKSVPKIRPENPPPGESCQGQVCMHHVVLFLCLSPVCPLDPQPGRGRDAEQVRPGCVCSRSAPILPLQSPAKQTQDKTDGFQFPTE